MLIPGTVARVVKPDGSLASYDEPGELVVKSPSVALGYANNEQAYVFKYSQLMRRLLFQQDKRDIYKWVK